MAHFTQNFSSLSAEAISALKYLFSIDTVFTIENSKITFDYRPSFMLELQFENLNKDLNDLLLYFYDGEMCEHENGYQFNITSSDFNGSNPFTFTCTNINCSFEINNALTMNPYADPWTNLRHTAVDICKKAIIIPMHCNEEEKEILPLLNELSELPPFSNRTHFPLLKSIAKELGFDDICAYLNKFEFKNKMRTTNYSLIYKLCNKKYEPLWRRIFDIVIKSQSEYPFCNEKYCQQDLNIFIRNEIEAQMKLNGYSGSYPHFEKHSSFPAVRIAESYGQTYFAGHSKTCVQYIDCYETHISDIDIVIEFFSAIAFPNKKYAFNDIYSCMFNSKGHSFFSFYISTISTLKEKARICELIEDAVETAVRKASLRII